VQGRSGERVSVTVRTSSGETAIEGSDILAAAGRVPNTTGIGLEEAGIDLDDRSYIRVNDRLETSAPDVWAVGECAGSPQFTHVAEDDFRIIRDNLAGGARSTHDRLVPYCMYTDPPLAHVGLSEGDASRQGIAVRVANVPTANVLRAQATGETQGLMKALIAADDDRILGFTMLGGEAGEVTAVVQTAMMAGLRAPDNGRGLGCPLLERARTERNAALVLVLDLTTADNAHRALAARLCIAEGEDVAIDLATQVAIGIGDQHVLKVFPVQLPDERFISLFAIAGQRRYAPKAPAILTCDGDQEVFLAEPRLIERALVGRPVSATARNDRVTLASPLPRHVRHLVSAERNHGTCNQRRNSKAHDPRSFHP
jgi:hypothetical protein